VKPGDELDLVVIDPLPSWVWYQDNPLIDDGSADRFLSGHPDSALP
jgi:hypothetical protein